MPFDPEGLEAAMTAELALRLPSWTFAASQRREEQPGTGIVRFRGVAVANQSLRQDPRFSKTGASETESTIEVVFNAARGAATGVFAGVLEQVLNACYNLSQARREDWTLDRFGEVERDAEGSDAPKIWRATCLVRTIV